MTKAVQGIWIIDAEANTLYANLAMAEILGTDISRLIGQPSFTYVYPEDATVAQQLFDSKSHGDAAPFRFRLRRADGSAIWVNVQGTPMNSAKGEFVGIVGTFEVSDVQS